MKTSFKPMLPTAIIAALVLLIIPFGLLFWKTDYTVLNILKLSILALASSITLWLFFKNKNQKIEA